jgi:hypothetical protein
MSKRELVDNRVVWQLSSANHRALARSVRVYPSVDDALADLRETRSQFERLTPRALKVSTRSEYVWIAGIAGDRRLMSARAYSTVRDTRDSIVAATDALQAASVVRRARAFATAS